ncbi:4797_t:CDS:1, partial [Rhizophagus irregularis]
LKTTKFRVASLHQSLMKYTDSTNKEAEQSKVLNELYHACSKLRM